MVVFRLQVGSSSLGSRFSIWLLLLAADPSVCQLPGGVWVAELLLVQVSAQTAAPLLPHVVLRHLQTAGLAILLPQRNNLALACPVLALLYRCRSLLHLLAVPLDMMVLCSREVNSVIS